MNFSAKIKHWFIKKNKTTLSFSDAADQGKAETGRPSENPYLTARRAWNEHVSSVVSARQTWQVVGILSLLIALAGVGGMIYIGSQSKFVPYVYEVDKFGESRAIGPVERAAPADLRIIRASVARFISDARLVTPDIALQRKAIFSIYAMLMPADPATTKMNEWLNGEEEANPFRRAAKEAVSVEITSVLQQTPETWQVDWTETLRDRQGKLKEQPLHKRALVTVYIQPPTSQTKEKQIRNNPVGLYVRDFSWSNQP